MKRVEVVVEREEMNSTRFDGVKEWGSAGCLELGEGKRLGKGGRRSASVNMSASDQRRWQSKIFIRTNRSDQIRLG